MTHDIYNPWHGCRKISEGCQNCYVYFMDRMWERDASVVARTRTAFKYPLQRYRDGRYKIESGERIRVCMTSDFFIEDADPWRPEVWRMLRFRSDVIWMLLTKRADRIERCLPPDWGDGYENVQLGVTAENQRRADERVPTLLSIPARHRHVNAAPLVGPVNLTPYLATGLLEFVQADGENYDGSRLCRHAWVGVAARPVRRRGRGLHVLRDGNALRGRRGRVPNPTPAGPGRAGVPVRPALLLAEAADVPTVRAGNDRPRPAGETSRSRPDEPALPDVRVAVRLRRLSPLRKLLLLTAGASSPRPSGENGGMKRCETPESSFT